MNVEIYTKPDCNYCTIAKNLLRNVGIPFSEQILDFHFTRDFVLQKFPSALSYPIVVVDGFYIGGYNQLQEIIELKRSSTEQLLNE